MANAAAVTLEQAAPETEAPGLPNKFIYPEFAGFAGEDLLHDIVSAILPLSLLRTWEIFERKHAYDNDCFLSLGTVAKKARRTQRTVNRNIATFLARGLLVLRSEYKFFRRPDGSTYKKAVVVKDFSGLYALAHEYYEWQYAENYLAPEYENLEHIQRDLHLQAKLCRFEDYRRLLEHYRDPFAQVQEDRRFTEYRADTPLHEEERVENVEINSSGQNRTKILPKERPNGLSEVSKERINEKAYQESLYRDSFDSGQNLEKGGGAGATSLYSQEQATVEQGYMKDVQENKTGTNTQNESPTNPVPSPQKGVSPSAGKTSESVENHPDVWQARQAMAAAGFALGRPARRQAEDASPPPKHLLARSFVHEIAGLFGDLNEKGSKTGIERSIEAFELEQPAEVLLCLVRAYVVARDTKDEKIRYHHPETGAANRMPLFCAMFKTFARALASGSPWEYTWQKMLADVEADDRLGLWLGEHQAELAEKGRDQAGTTDEPASPAEREQETQAREEDQETAVLAGWTDRAAAYDQGERLLQAIVDANYEAEVKLRCAAGRYYVVLVGGGEEAVLAEAAEIEYVIEQAQLGQL